VLFRRLGSSGILVSAMGLGRIGMWGGYGATRTEYRQEKGEEHR
jgi:hypothetical protein